MQYFPKVIWIQNYVLSLTWNLLPSFRKNTLGNAGIKDNILDVVNWFLTGSEHPQRCSIKMISLLSTDADTPHLYRNPPEGLVENVLLQPKIYLCPSQIQQGGDWLPCLKPNLKCRSSQMTIFQATGPCDLTGIYFYLQSNRRIWSHLCYDILDNTN